MNIKITSLSDGAHKRMRQECGEKIFEESEFYIGAGTYNVVLNEYAIMKAHNDVIFFDLGGQLTSIERCDFHEITIF